MDDQQVVVREDERDEFEEIARSIRTDHEDLRRRRLGIKIDDRNWSGERVSDIDRVDSMSR